MKIFTRSLWACAAALVLATQGQAQTIAGLGGDRDYGADSRWVATWSAAPLAPGPLTIDSIFPIEDRNRSFDNQTIRHVVHTSVGGRRVRVRISNTFGILPLRVGAAHVGADR